MAAIIQFIAENSLWLLLVCLAFCAAFVVLLLRARRSMREALFGLELELATTRLRRAIRMLLPSILLAAVVFLVANVIEPQMPSPAIFRPTATPDIFITPPPTFTNITPSPTPTLTPTLPITTPSPVFLDTLQPAGTAEMATTETPTPGISQAPDALCEISEPADGSTVNGQITFVGSASVADLAFYKLEALGPETGNVWASIIGDVVTAPVIDGVLGVANLTGWARGEYSARVVLVDATRNEVGECLITFTLVDQ